MKELTDEELQLLWEDALYNELMQWHEKMKTNSIDMDAETYEVMNNIADEMLNEMIDESNTKSNI